MKKFLLPSLFVLSSCSSVIHTPATRMISPESNGKFLSGAIDVRLGAAKQDRMEFTGNDTNEPFDGKSQEYKVSGLVDMGLIDRLDAIYLTHLSATTPGVLGLKVQVLGKNKHEAKKGNFSLSLYGGTGGSDASYDDLDNDLNDWTTNVEKLSYEVEHHEGGLIVGYRSSDRLLHYVNGIYFHELLRGKVTTDGNTLVDAKFRDTQDGMLYSTGIIYDLGAKWFFKADYSHMTSKWSSSRNTTNNSINGAIGASW